MSAHLTLRAKRLLRRNSRRPGVVSLNLVPMIDVFMVLVFFLLVTTSSIDNMRSPRELTLPTSLSLDQPNDAPIIMVTRQAVLIQGVQVMTLDEAIAAPAVNKTGVIRRNGKKARFSFEYRPGATNRQSCVASTGKATMVAAKKATLISTKKASKMSVKISLPCPAASNGWTRKPKIGFAK